MKIFINVFVILFLNNVLLAETIISKNKFKNYSEAETSKEYLKFLGKSTKFKLVTTEFVGFAKEFTFNYDIKNNIISNLKVIVKSSEIDTDNSSRNEKMYKLCLKADEYPEIEVSSEELIPLKEQSDGVINIRLKVKDREVFRKLTFTMLKEEKGFRVNLKTDFSFVEAGIEDPSILIAKVHELFNIEGSLFIKSEK